eukprot:2098279-Lingulodinium_polyedra.AAC.1
MDVGRLIWRNLWDGALGPPPGGCCTCRKKEGGGTRPADLPPWIANPNLGPPPGGRCSNAA